MGKRDRPSLMSHLLPGLDSWARLGAAPRGLRVHSPGGRYPHSLSPVSDAGVPLSAPRSLSLIEGQGGEVESEKSVLRFLLWPWLVLRRGGSYPASLSVRAPCGNGNEESKVRTPAGSTSQGPCMDWSSGKSCLNVRSSPVWFHHCHLGTPALETCSFLVLIHSRRHRCVSNALQQGFCAVGK